jgi:outer membrane lipoprotein-sorting protein
VKLLALVVAVVIAVPAAAHAQQRPALTADQVLDGVQTFYAGIPSLSAKFRQEVVNATFGTTTVSDGNLLIKKPGKMRWSYLGKKHKGHVKVEKEFISDGTTLWVVDRANHKTVTQSLQGSLLPSAITFLSGKGSLAADFTPALDASGTFGSATDLVISLAPKTPSAQYKSLHLVVDATTFRVRESILVDSADSTNHFRFYAPDFAAKLSDRLFKP